MGDSPTTHGSLLLQIRDGRDRQAWSTFVDLYAPVIYRYLRRRGLQDADAADLTQDVLGAVSTAARTFNYDPARGTFRGWLFTLARNRLLNFFSSRQRDWTGTGDSDAHRLLQEHPAPETDQTDWEADCQRQLFHCAANQIRGDFQEATWRAFWLTSVEGRPAKEVAEQLHLTVSAIYVGKSRVMARLKDQVRWLQGDDA